MPLVPAEVPVDDEPGRRDAVAVRPQGTDQLVVDGDVAHGRSVAAKGALTVGEPNLK